MQPVLPPSHSPACPDSPAQTDLILCAGAVAPAMVGAAGAAPPPGSPDELEMVTCRGEVSLEISLDAKGAVPTEVTLIKAGRVRTLRGDFLFDKPAAEAVLAAANEWGNQFCFDYGHAMVAPGWGSDPADTERAAGWYNLKVNDAGDLVTDGLSFTKRAQQMLADRELRYLSPTFIIDSKSKRIVEFINAALTNLPATKNMKPIVASRTTASPPPETPPMKSLLAALSLTASASEDEALAALKKQLNPRDELLALTGKTDPESALSVVKSWKDGASKAVELKAEMAAAKDESEKKAIKKAVKKAIEKGHLPPSMKDEMLELGRKSGVEFIEKTLKSLKKLARTEDDVEQEQPAVTTGKGKDVKLTADEEAMLSILGMDREKFIATKQAAGGVKVSELSTEVAKGDATATATTPMSATAKLRQTTSKD